MGFWQKLVQSLAPELQVLPAEPEGAGLDPLNQRVAALLQTGMEQARIGELSQALATFHQAIALDPQRAISYYNRGCIHYDLLHLEAALEDFNQAIRLNPALGVAHANRALVWMELGDWDSALLDLNQAIALDPTVMSISKLNFIWLRGERITAGQ